MSAFLETRHLRLVAAIADLGSLTSAGRQLNLTQSALSHQLLDLERRIGAPLFHRMGKRMVATAAGARLLAAARPMLAELEAAESDLRRLASGQDAVLRLSTECYTCYHWLPAILAPFGERFPRVEVRIVAEATRRPLEALLDGRIDLGVVHDVPDDERLTTVPIFEDELVIVAAPQHRLAGQQFVRAEDLADEHLLVYCLPRGENSIFRKILDPAGVLPKRVSEISLTEAIVEMVKAGLGVAALARWSVAPHVEAGTLRALPLGEAGFRRTWSAAMLRAESERPHLREFAALLSGGPMGRLARTSAGRPAA